MICRFERTDEGRKSDPIVRPAMRAEDLMSLSLSRSLCDKIASLELTFLNQRICFGIQQSHSSIAITDSQPLSFRFTSKRDGTRGCKRGREAIIGGLARCQRFSREI